MLEKLDARVVPERFAEIRAFITVRNERNRLPCLLRHYRDLGVDRFFFVDNMSTDGSSQYLLEQRDCHVYQTSGNHFAENIDPPRWLNALLTAFGDGYWCLTVDSDELFIYPNFETIGLLDFCAYLGSRNYEALSTPMIDMYSAKPILQTRHQVGAHFLDTCPLFDPQPDWEMPVATTPGWQMFGGVRRRVFWQGVSPENVPPCISKVPLIKWRHGMHYLVAAHIHSGARVAPLRGALLHFKFMDGVAVHSTEQLAMSAQVTEKSLGERELYLRRLREEPDLCLANSRSQKYESSAQLVDCGWMRTSKDYERFVATHTRRNKNAGVRKTPARNNLTPMGVKS